MGSKKPKLQLTNFISSVEDIIWTKETYNVKQIYSLSPAFPIIAKVVDSYFYFNGSTESFSTNEILWLNASYNQKRLIMESSSGMYWSVPKSNEYRIRRNEKEDYRILSEIRVKKEIGNWIMVDPGSACCEDELQNNIFRSKVRILKEDKMLILLGIRLDQDTNLIDCPPTAITENLHLKMALGISLTNEQPLKWTQFCSILRSYLNTMTKNPLLPGIILFSKENIGSLNSLKKLEKQKLKKEKKKIKKEKEILTTDTQYTELSTETMTTPVYSICQTLGTENVMPGDSYQREKQRKQDCETSTKFSKKCAADGYFKPSFFPKQIPTTGSMGITPSSQSKAIVQIHSNRQYEELSKTKTHSYTALNLTEPDPYYLEIDENLVKRFSKVSCSISSRNDLPQNVNMLSKGQVSDCLYLLHLDRHVENFKENDIDGSILVDLTKDLLVEDLGFTRIEAIKLRKFVDQKWLPDS